MIDVATIAILSGIGLACAIIIYIVSRVLPKEDETLARSIKPRARYYMNALDRENGGVKILSVGVILFNKIIATILDEDYGDITDPQNGFDFKIVKTMDSTFSFYLSC